MLFRAVGFFGLGLGGELEPSTADAPDLLLTLVADAPILLGPFCTATGMLMGRKCGIDGEIWLDEDWEVVLKGKERVWWSKDVGADVINSVTRRGDFRAFFFQSLIALIDVS